MIFSRSFGNTFVRMLCSDFVHFNQVFCSTVLMFTLSNV